MKPILLLSLALLTGCVTTAPRQAEVTIPAPVMTPAKPTKGA